MEKLLFSPTQGHAEPKFSNIFPPSEDICLKGYSLQLCKLTKKMDITTLSLIPLVFYLSFI